MSVPETDRESEAGYTIVEMMITSALLIIVVISVLSALDSVSSTQAFQADRTNAIDDMRNVLNKMTHDLRQATAITDCGSNSATISFSTYINGTTTAIVYTASGTTLSRTQGSGTAFTVLKNLASTQVFTCSSATDVTGVQWVTIDLKVTPKKLPTTTLELSSEVNLRNRTAILAGGAS
jgi:Tfp pilus assembly protein PilW